jgi:hypothetical protein
MKFLKIKITTHGCVDMAHITRNNSLKLGCSIPTIPIINKFCCLLHKTFKYESNYNCKVGSSMIVLLILVNISLIRSTKFASVLDWSEISMVPIISIDYKTTSLFCFSKMKPSCDPKRFVIGWCTPWYVPTSQTIAPSWTSRCKTLNIFMICL